MKTGSAKKAFGDYVYDQDFKLHDDYFDFKLH